MTIRSNILTPKAVKGWVSHNSVLGTNAYDLDNMYSPDTAMRKACVLDLAPPKYNPHKKYWFDKSLKNNHGTITGGVFGSTGWTLDGDDSLLIPNHASLSVDSDFTFLVWIKTTNTVGGFIASFTNTPAVYGDGFAFGINLAGSGSGIMAATCTGSSAWFFGTKAINDNSWHLVGLRLSGTTLDLLLDNTIDGTRVDSAPLPYTGNRRIGSNTAGTGNFLTGTIGQIWYYNAGLSDAVVAHIRNATKWRYTS